MLPNVVNLCILCLGDMQLSLKIKEAIQSTKCTKCSSFCCGVYPFLRHPNFCKTEISHPSYIFISLPFWFMYKFYCVFFSFSFKYCVPTLSFQRGCTHFCWALCGQNHNLIALPILKIQIALLPCFQLITVIFCRFFLLSLVGFFYFYF